MRIFSRPLAGFQPSIFTLSGAFLTMICVLAARGAFAADVPDDPSDMSASVAFSRPFIWVRDSDRETILAKIEQHAWARSVFETMVKRAQPHLERHQENRDAFLRQLPVLWDASPPRFKTYPKHSKRETVWRSHGIYNAGLDCAILFYLTGEDKYADCAATILHNAVQLLLPIPPSKQVWNGGWVMRSDLLYEARIIGTQLPVMYDFLQGYLRSHRVFDIKTGEMIDFPFDDAQTVFRTYARLVRDHGHRGSNWSALMSTCMLHSILALDDAAERQALLNVHLETGAPRQNSLSQDCAVYQKHGLVWPESLQYAQGVANIRVLQMVILERYDSALKLFATYPQLPKALSRIRYFRYPNNSMKISFGDGHRRAGRQPFMHYELVYRHARDRGYEALATRMGGLIARGIAAGRYDRAKARGYSNLSEHCEPLQLLLQCSTVDEEPESFDLPRTDRLPHAGIALQRNPSTIDNAMYGLMGFVGGAAHVHNHASGMSMELYGLGHVLGAKGGRASYSSKIHQQYYALFAANNTIIVNGASRGQGGWKGRGMNTVKVVAMEPAPFEAGVSADLSFTCSSFQDDRGSLAEADQQRTLAIIRTSPKSGFYVDIFRSRSAVTSRTAETLAGPVTDQFHDYIYRNIGTFEGPIKTKGKALTLHAQPERFESDLGDRWKQPGWRFFENTMASLPYKGETSVCFEAAPDGETPVYMTMVMPAVAERELAQVDSPPISDAPPPLNKAPAPTVVVRHIGDAWDAPFVSVFEPHETRAGTTLKNTTVLWRDNVAVGVKVESEVNGTARIHYVLSNPGGDEAYADPKAEISFKGRFAIIADQGGGRHELYLGNGQSLSYRGVSLSAKDAQPTQASVLIRPDAVPAVTANAPVQITIDGASPPQRSVLPPESGIERGN